MEIISLMAIKGGVGKTTLAFQLAKYLEQNKMRVLMLDMDAQRSLTGTFSKSNDFYAGKDKVADILQKPRKEYVATKVSEKIDLFPATSDLNLIASEMETKTYKELALFMWFAYNNESLSSKYDYVIVDLPPAWNLLTQNGVAVADKILSPLEPSRFGYESHGKVISAVNSLKESLIDPATGNKYVTAEIYFVGNRVKHNTNSSHSFLEALKEEEDVIGYIPEKELVNSSMLAKKSIWEFGKEKGDNFMWSQRTFYQTVESVFDRLTER